VHRRINRPTNRTQGKTIMAVDDSKSILALLGEIITDAGYHFVGESYPLKGLSRFESCSPDLLLIDVEMPDMNGFELCRQIRASKPTRPVPIAFLTICNKPEDIRAGVDAGGNGYILKPFPAGTLLKHINHWAHRAVGLQN
jgi:CheY-like chemotaxis protein